MCPRHFVSVCMWRLYGMGTPRLFGGAVLHWYLSGGKNECSNNLKQKFASSAAVHIETGNFTDSKRRSKHARTRACRKRSWKAYQCLMWSASSHAPSFWAMAAWRRKGRYEESQATLQGFHAVRERFTFGISGRSRGKLFEHHRSRSTAALVRYQTPGPRRHPTCGVHDPERNRTTHDNFAGTPKVESCSKNIPKRRKLCCRLPITRSQFCSQKL
jgi:hypothetical protein